jgi:hypothetical protein
MKNKIIVVLIIVLISGCIGPETQKENITARPIKTLPIETPQMSSNISDNSIDDDKNKNINASYIEWEKTFGTDGDETANVVLQTKNEGYIIGGSKSGKSWVIKTDINGNEEWDKTFGEIDGVRSALQTPDDGYVFLGSNFSFEHFYDSRIIKTDKVGVEQWNRTFGGTGLDGIAHIEQTSDGGFILAGGTESYGFAHSSAWVIKTDENGIEQWNRTYIIGDNSQTKASGSSHIKQTSDEGYILAGNIFLNDNTSFRGSYAWLVKIDKNGKKQWSKTFRRDISNDIGIFAQEISDGYIFAGTTEKMKIIQQDNATSIIGGLRDTFLIKTDKNGNEKWNKTFGGEGDDIVTSVQQTSDKGYILAATTQLNGTSDSNFWLIKTDENGNEQWNKTFGGEKNEFASSVNETKDGGYIVVGYTESFGAGLSDVWLVKVKGDLIFNGKIELTFPEIGDSLENVKNTTQLKQGYLLSLDNVSFFTVPKEGTTVDLRTANFSIYINGEIVKRLYGKEGDTLYYNKTGRDIIKFKIDHIFVNSHTLVWLEPFYQYSDIEI